MQTWELEMGQCNVDLQGTTMRAGYQLLTTILVYDCTGKDSHHPHGLAVHPIYPMAQALMCLVLRGFPLPIVYM